jgi:spermidine synthase
MSAGLWFTELWEKPGVSFSLKVIAQLWREETPYQCLEVFETENFGTTMTLDGVLMLTDRDNFFYHEMMTHMGLFSHPNPKRIAIVGGGDCGSLNETLKHDTVQSAHLIELDESVTRAAERFFPDLCSRNQDPRVSFHFTDGIGWMENAPAGSYDLIIIDSTDPIGQAARLFGETFYTACYKALASPGILAVQSESPFLYLPLIKSIRRNMRAAGFDEVLTAPFPQPTYPSGYFSTTLAAKGLSFAHFRKEDALQKVFETQYYNASIHEAALLATPEFLKGS